MSGWWWVLIVGACLCALLVTALTMVLASVLIGSVSDSDRRWGFLLVVAALAWLALPGGGTWMLLHGRIGWGGGLLGFSAVASVLLMGFIAGSIGAAARP